MKRLLYVLLLPGLLLPQSCNFSDVNVNPNQPTDVPMSVLLSQVQVSATYLFTDSYTYFPALFVQHLGGVNNQPLRYDRYDVPKAEIGGFGIYAGALQDLRVIIDKANAANSPHYAGVSKVLMAHLLGQLSDLFGDIPLSNAFKGTANLTPTYDTQEQVYAAVQKMLDEAITELGQANSVQTPRTDDLIFGGNRTRWIATAYTLKARNYIHLTKRNAREAATNALAALYSGTTYRGLASNADDCQMIFTAGALQANPWFQYQATRGNDLRLGRFLVNLLNGNPTAGMPVDPRREVIALPNATGGMVFSGLVPGAGVLPAANLGPGIASATAPITIISFAEAKFIEAEARLILNENDPLAQTALTTAIGASMADLAAQGGITAPTAATVTAYMAARGTLSGPAAQKLETIITQKYIALVLQPEVWTDYRRTGLPALQPAVGGSNSLNPSGQIPRRFTYPQDEEQRNPNVPKNTTLESPRLWWDA